MDQKIFYLRMYLVSSVFFLWFFENAWCRITSNDLKVTQMSFDMQVLLALERIEQDEGLTHEVVICVQLHR